MTIGAQEMEYDRGRLCVWPDWGSSIHPKHETKLLNWVNDGLLLGYEKTKGREWLEHSATSNSQQDQVNAALTKARIYKASNEYNQAARASFSPSTNTITLLKNADLSSFSP